MKPSGTEDKYPPREAKKKVHMGSPVHSSNLQKQDQSVRRCSVYSTLAKSGNILFYLLEDVEMTWLVQDGRLVRIQLCQWGTRR